MTLKWLFFQEIAKTAHQLESSTQIPVHNTLELHQFAQHAAQLQHVLNRIILTFGLSPLVVARRFILIQSIIDVSLASPPPPPPKQFLRAPLLPPN